MDKFERTILITGGCGFIGSALIRYLVDKYPQYHIINYDKLTYAADMNNVKSVGESFNYLYIKGDIVDKSSLSCFFEHYEIDTVIHLAAETHVDRSITNPMEFVKTNVMGTVNLLECYKRFRKDIPEGVFYHISTDEVYGALNNDENPFNENNKYCPSSPYSASKASSDHFVRAYGTTYNIPYVISNCSNNYGPCQYPEKLIPKTIKSIMNNEKITIYGSGLNIRDWLYVDDHVKAIDVILHSNRFNTTYNIGGNCEVSNLSIVNKICDIMDKKLKPVNSYRNLITFVEDRQGHDFRYAIDSSKLQQKLGWTPDTKLDSGLDITIDWYLNR